MRIFWISDLTSFSWINENLLFRKLNCLMLQTYLDLMSTAILHVVKFFFLINVKRVKVFLVAKWNNLRCVDIRVRQIVWFSFDQTWTNVSNADLKQERNLLKIEMDNNWILFTTVIIIYFGCIFDVIDTSAHVQFTVSMSCH